MQMLTSLVIDHKKNRFYLLYMYYVPVCPNCIINVLSQVKKNVVLYKEQLIMHIMLLKHFIKTGEKWNLIDTYNVWSKNVSLQL